MKLLWDQTGEKIYETGTDRGVVYNEVLQNKQGYGNGAAWNGLTAVTESPSGAEPTDLYADNIKYLTMRSAEEFGGTIEAYTYPDEFAVCDGSAMPANGVVLAQQARRAFGFSYRSLVGNDTHLNDFAYKLHLIYNATASPSEKSYSTVNDSPEAITFSWEFTTVPESISVKEKNGKPFKPTAQITIDTSKADKAKVEALEAILYGTDGQISYNAFKGSDFEAGVDYYELDSNTNEYVKTQDLTFDSSKTYYTKTETGGVAARLPLPDEVLGIFMA